MREAASAGIATAIAGGGGTCSVYAGMQCRAMRAPKLLNGLDHELVHGLHRLRNMQNHHESPTHPSNLPTAPATIARDELSRASGGSPVGLATDIAKNTGKATLNAIDRGWYRWHAVDENGNIPKDYPKFEAPFKDNPTEKVRQDIRKGARSVFDHVKHWL